MFTRPWTGTSQSFPARRICTNGCAAFVGRINGPQTRAPWPDDLGRGHTSHLLPALVSALCPSGTQHRLPRQSDLPRPVGLGHQPSSTDAVDGLGRNGGIGSAREQVKAREMLSLVDHSHSGKCIRVWLSCLVSFPSPQTRATRATRPRLCIHEANPQPVRACRFGRLVVRADRLAVWRWRLRRECDEHDKSPRLTERFLQHGRWQHTRPGCHHVDPLLPEVPWTERVDMLPIRGWPVSAQVLCFVPFPAGGARSNHGRSVCSRGTVRGSAARTVPGTLARTKSDSLVRTMLAWGWFFPQLGCLRVFGVSRVAPGPNLAVVRKAPSVCDMVATLSMCPISSAIDNWPHVCPLTRNQAMLVLRDTADVVDLGERRIRNARKPGE